MKFTCDPSLSTINKTGCQHKFSPQVLKYNRRTAYFIIQATGGVLNTRNELMGLILRKAGRQLLHVTKAALS